MYINGLTKKRTKTLRQRQKAILRRLPPLKAILRGSLVERYKPCGKPGCKCAKGPGHGPKYYLSVSSPRGRRRWTMSQEASGEGQTIPEELSEGRKRFSNRFRPSIANCSVAGSLYRCTTPRTRPSPSGARPPSYRQHAGKTRWRTRMTKIQSNHLQKPPTFISGSRRWRRCVIIRRARRGSMLSRRRRSNWDGIRQ